MRLRGLVCALVGLVVLGLPAGTYAAGACPNEAAREEQHSTFLPDCRGYEMVSPADKNGANIYVTPFGTEASTDGEKIYFRARGQFADILGSGHAGVNEYIATRGEAGWVTHGITPLTAAGVEQVYQGTDYVALSEDLSSGIVNAFEIPGVPGGAPGVFNMYRTEFATGAFEAVTRSEGSTAPNAVDLSGEHFDGASGDVDHAIFETRDNLLSDASGSGRKVYEWSHGAMRIADVLPDGTVPAAGATAFSQNGGHLRKKFPMISQDGSRVFFLAPRTGAGSLKLYMRKDGTSTTWVSQSEATEPAETPSPVSFQAASPTGAKVLFTSQEGLVDADSNARIDLYMYTDGPMPESEANLTLISAGLPEGEVRDINVLGMSGDGSRVYFVASFQETSTQRLYLWEKGTLRHIADLSSDRDPMNWNPEEPTSSVTPDGMHLEFTSELPQAGGYDNNGRIEVYLYDAGTEVLACASCNPSGAAATSDAGVHPLTSASTNIYFGPGVSSPLTSDGRRVFFSTADALVPQDVNGRYDAYEYDASTGSVSLLSTGRDEGDSFFADADADGDNVFVLTGQRLVGWDKDGLIDMYDVRAGGGLPEPPPTAPVCVGEDCQGQAGIAPVFGLPASIGLAGEGNIAAAPAKPIVRGAKPKRKAKGQKRKSKRRRGKVKKSSGSSKRASRRTGR